LLQEIHIVGPILAGIGLIIWVLYMRIRDGLGPKDLIIDRQFLTALFYTGALLSIYLSCVHYYSVASAHPAAVTNGP
jgi:hypothetical protein